MRDITLNTEQVNHFKGFNTKEAVSMNRSLIECETRKATIALEMARLEELLSNLRLEESSINSKVKKINTSLTASEKLTEDLK